VVTTWDDLESPKTFLPGVKAKHAIISSVCRANRGDAGAADEAVDRLRVELGRLMEAWDPERGATFHLVLTVDRAGRGDPNA
jgi:hypothetical protein